MRRVILVALSVLAVSLPLAADPASAAQCPAEPCPVKLLPLNYSFGVVIKQDIPGTVPQIQGTLMSGCSFTAVTNYGTVTCSPPTAPPTGFYWTCDSAGLITTAATGTVTGTTQCAGGPAVTAVATFPAPNYVWNIAIGTWGFSWTCTADFTGLLATGNVLCDEPDPPVQYW